MRKNRTIPFGILATSIAATFGFLLCVSTTVRASDSTRITHRVSLDQVRQVIIGELRPRLGEAQLPSVDDIELPLAVPTRSGSTLKVSSSCWDEDALRTRIQLECTHRGECLPFFAYVRTTSRANLPACQAEAVHATPRSSQSQVRAGEQAMAVLSGAGIRINAAVTCLQGGNPGDIIRVRGHEGRIFRARIIGPALVEASME